MVRIDGGEGVPRHVRVRRVPRRLHYGDAAAPLYGEEAGRAVAEEPREDDADDAAPVVDGGRAEEGIDGRPAPVLAGAERDADAIFDEEEVPVRRRHVDPPALDGHAVLGGYGRERPPVGQDLA